MKKNILFVLALSIICIFFTIPANADVYTPSEQENKNKDPYEADTSIGNLIGESAEKATVDNLKGYIDNISTKTIDIMQYGSKPIIVVIFIVAAFLTLCGVLGDGSLVFKGIVGMITCGVVFTLIFYAPQAIGFISGFFAP